MNIYSFFFIGIGILTNPCIAGVKKNNDDAFMLGKIVALNEDALKKKKGFTRIEKAPSWDFGYGAPAWLTKPGAKVIVRQPDGRFTYGIVATFKRPTITVITHQKNDGSYEKKEYNIATLGKNLAWVHKSWITKKRGALLMDKEKVFVNYNHETKNFDPFIF